MRIAAHALEVAPDDIEITTDGYSASRAPPTRRRRSAEIAGAAYGGNVPAGDEPGLEATRFFTAPGETFPFGVHIAVVEIDKDTGRVTFRRMICVDDVRHRRQPDAAGWPAPRRHRPGRRPGALRGGHLRRGRPVADRHASATTPCPTAHMLPMFELDRTVTLSPRNPLGVKGIGEAGTIGSTPAVRSAVLDALRQAGVKSFDMPASAVEGLAGAPGSRRVARLVCLREVRRS